MRKEILLISSLLFIPSLSGRAVETFQTIFVDGVAPIVVDGDLSDWEGI